MTEIESPIHMNGKNDIICPRKNELVDILNDNCGRAGSTQGQEGEAPPQIKNVLPPQIKILEVEKAHFNIVTINILQVDKITCSRRKIYWKRDTHDTVSASLSSRCPSAVRVFTGCAARTHAHTHLPQTLSKYPITVAVCEWAKTYPGSVVSGFTKAKEREDFEEAAASQRWVPTSTACDKLKTNILCPGADWPVVETFILPHKTAAGFTEWTVRLGQCNI